MFHISTIYITVNLYSRAIYSSRHELYHEPAAGFAYNLVPAVEQTGDGGAGYEEGPWARMHCQARVGYCDAR